MPDWRLVDRFSHQTWKKKSTSPKKEVGEIPIQHSECWAHRSTIDQHKAIKQPGYSLFYQKWDYINDWEVDVHCAITAFLLKLALEGKVTKACHYTPIVGNKGWTVNIYELLQPLYTYLQCMYNILVLSHINLVLYLSMRIFWQMLDCNIPTPIHNLIIFTEDWNKFTRIWNMGMSHPKTSSQMY